MSVFPLLSDFREGEHAYPPPADKKTVVGSAPLLKVPHVKHDIVGCVGLPVGQLPMETRWNDTRREPVFFVGRWHGLQKSEMISAFGGERFFCLDKKPLQM